MNNGNSKQRKHDQRESSCLSGSAAATKSICGAIRRECALFRPFGCCSNALGFHFMTCMEQKRKIDAAEREER